jgi:chromosome segregation ATPase
MEFTSKQTNLLIKMLFDKLEDNRQCMELDETQLNALCDALEESREEVASLKKELASIKKEAKALNISVVPVPVALKNKGGRPKKVAPVAVKRKPGRPKKAVK